MAPALSLHMQMRVGPQLVLAGQMLRTSGAGLDDLIQAELQANPALELVRDVAAHQYRLPSTFHAYTSSGLHIEDWEQVASHQVAQVAVVEQLVEQVTFLIERADLPLAIELIDALDEYGYLGESVANIAQRLGMLPQHVERVRQALHELEPPGIGACDLRECLLIQCAHLQAVGVDCSLPRRLLQDAWEEFTAEELSARSYKRVGRKIGATVEQVQAAAGFITRNLHPYPLSLVQGSSSPTATPLVPDLIIRRQAGEPHQSFRLEIPGEELYELRLSQSFERVLSRQAKDTSSLAPAEQEWVRSQAELARQFMLAMEQRWGTLRRVGEFIITFQQAYLEHGPGFLKPLTRAGVAAALGLHESTISRAVSDKIIQLPNGRQQPLSELFDASLPARDRVRTLLSQAGGRLSDREIADRLQAEGISVARRTVTKYREQLNNFYR